MEIVKQGPVSIDDIKKVYDNSTVHCAVVTDASNKILYVSQSLADALGYEIQELDGAEFSIDPAIQEEPVLDNGISNFEEEPSNKGYLVQKNGAKALVDYETVPLSNPDTGYTLSRISNLEGYVQYNRLSAFTSLIENVLNHLPVSIVVINSQLVTEKINKTFSNTFLQGKFFSEKIELKKLNCPFWQNQDLILQLKNNYDKGHYNFDIEEPWEKEDNTTLFFTIASRIIFTSDNDDGNRMMLIVTDITEEKANQTGRNQQIRHIMHELRNPLSNLALCIELLTDSTKENNQEDTNLFLSKAGNSIQRMKLLINDLNEFKK